MTDTPWYAKNYREMLKYKGRILPLAHTQAQLDYSNRNVHRDTDHLHPSELAKRDWCPRAAWYKIKKYPATAESSSFSRLNVFEEGHGIHHKWQTWLWKAGVLSGNWKCKNCNHVFTGVSPSSCSACGDSNIHYAEVPIYSEEYKLIGHADGEVVDKEGKALIEIKSVGLGTVRWEHPSLHKAYSDGLLSLDSLWNNIKKPFVSHIRQGQIYMHFTGHDEIVFIYEWKPSQEVKEFRVKYQEDIVQPILDNCKLVIKHLDNDTLPDTPVWAESINSSGCKFCPYKKECWK